ncbi:MAG TPA: extracellular solute-binding protein [Chloroflexi bacterium]|nr:extracellular solute-binding protein [Chloroflexota bacterium]
MLKSKKMLLTTLLGLLVLIWGIQGMANSPAKITVYMGPIPLAQKLEAAFEAEHGDVLTVVSGPWCRRVRAEMEAGDIKADVLYGADLSIYLLLWGVGQLLPYSSPEATAIKPEFRAEGPFTLANGRYAAIVYNKRFVSPEEAPKGWNDLLDSKWKGKVVMGDPLLCSAAFAIVCGLVQSHGFDWDYIRALRKNEVMLANNAGKVAEVVASGEAWVGICVHDAALRMIKKAEKQGLEPVLGIVWPKEGAIPIPRPAAIVWDEERSEEDTTLAKAFLDFVLSPEGQRIAAKYGFIPVRADVPTPAGIPKRIRAIPIDWDWISKHDRILRDKWQAVMAGN